MLDVPSRAAPARASTPRRTRWDRLAWCILGASIAAYALLFGWLSIQAYEAFQMHALDMANMAQAAWNTVHGHPFAFTTMRLAYGNIEAWGTTTRLSFHVEAIFPVISLVYLIYPHPESLLVLQTAALALGAIPVFLLARDVLRSRLLALVFSLAYLLFPALEAMNLYEFHPVALATPLLLGAFLFAARRQYWLFFLCALAAMGTKEEIGLVVAMFGLYIAVVQGARKAGIAAALVGVGWSLFATLVVEHHFRQPGSMSYLHSRYGYLLPRGTHGLHGVLHTLLYNPGVVLSVLFTWPKFWYVEHLLAPTGFLALLAPQVLLLGLPTVAINLLSTEFHMYTALGQDSAELIAVFMIASVLGAGWVLSRTGGHRAVQAALALLVLGMALLEQRIEGFSPMGARFAVPIIGAHQRIQAHFVAMIPPGVPVSTQDQLAPHLSDRRYLYLFEDTGRPPTPPSPYADYILLDASAPTYPLPSFQLYDRAQSYLHRPGWGIAAARDGLILIERGATRKAPPAAFYSFMHADRAAIQHPAHIRQGALTYLGYSRQETDLTNHRVPNLAYTFYYRANRRPSRNVQPVLYEITPRGTPAGCQNVTLGLAWLPTGRWKPGALYAVRMQPLETGWQTPEILHLAVELRSAETGNPRTCGELWQGHGTLIPAGTLNVTF